MKNKMKKYKIAVLFLTPLVISAIVIPTALHATARNTLTTDKEALTSEKETLTSEKTALTKERNALLAEKMRLKSWVKNELVVKRQKQKALQRAGTPAYELREINLLTRKVRRTLSFDPNDFTFRIWKGALNLEFRQFMNTHPVLKAYILPPKVRFKAKTDKNGVTYANNYWPVSYIEIEDNGKVHRITNIVGYDDKLKKWTSTNYRLKNWPTTPDQPRFRLKSIDSLKLISSIKPEKNLIDTTQVELIFHSNDLKRFANPVLKTVMLRFEPRRDWNKPDVQKSINMLEHARKLDNAFTRALLNKINE